MSQLLRSHFITSKCPFFAASFIALFVQLSLRLLYNHFSSVKWLYNNKKIHCYPRCNNLCKKNNHKKIVKWLKNKLRNYN